ncbi:MAG: YeeE/YedE family protein [Oceanococcus sp.]|nr:MAG: YeeE/YedE family protein [Oceanococcus sp.]
MYTVTEFTPWTALGGGMLIGLSALLMLGFNGRIAGISGIVGNLVTSRGSDLSWRLAFTLGLIGGAYGFIAFAPPDALNIHVEVSLPMMIFAGFVVGLGTKLGSGCTSGHGVCGIGRVSPRSITATAVFMLVAFATVFIIRHVAGV